MRQCRWCRSKMHPLARRNRIGRGEMMSLRATLLIGYLLFVAALVALGAWSVWRFRELGSVTQLIVTENYDSVEAAEEMKDSLERQDSAVVLALTGQDERARVQLRE